VIEECIDIGKKRRVEMMREGVSKSEERRVALAEVGHLAPTRASSTAEREAAHLIVREDSGLAPGIVPPKGVNILHVAL
jgi:hypothetical protein